MKDSKMVTISAYSADYNEKCYKLLYGKNSCEFIPKSVCNFVENSKGGSDFGDGIASRFFAVPEWLLRKLKGVDFYTIIG